MSAHIYSCPLQLYASRDMRSLVGLETKSLELYSSQNGKSWQQQLFQLDDGGVSTKQPLVVNRNTRVTVDSQYFGASKSKVRAPLSCSDGKLSKTFEIQDLHSKKVSYLVYCNQKKGPRIRLKDTGSFVHDKKNFVFQTAGLRFVYKPWNFFLFKKTSLFDRTQKKWLPVGEDASFNLHLNVKRFFNINLSDRRVATDLMFMQQGDLSLSARLRFFLKILFFKINLSANSFASFYEGGVHLPLVFNIPMDTSTRLHKGSGFLFYWKNTGMKFLNLANDGAMPVWNHKRYKEDFAGMRKKALTFCDSRSCRFTLKSVVGKDQFFTMTMQQSRAATEQGFFPIWVEDSADFNRKMDLGLSAKKLKGKVGVYQESSQLLKGLQRTDIWIHRDQRVGSSYMSCPPPLKVRLLR